MPLPRVYDEHVQLPPAGGAEGLPQAPQMGAAAVQAQINQMVAGENAVTAAEAAALAAAQEAAVKAAADEEERQRQIDAVTPQFNGFNFGGPR